MILITGAAGKTGQAISHALSNQGVAVRAFVYRAEQIELMQAIGAQEAVFGDLLDKAALKQVVQGVQAIYHICPNMNPNEIEIGRRIINAARLAGVSRFVYHSVLRPHTQAMPHHWHKLLVEEMIFESGLNFTILQPAAYMQNILANWQTIKAKGIYTVPYPVETRLSVVDLGDVAAIAAKFLTESSHTSAIYELAGSENPNQIEVAKTFSQVLGRSVMAQQISIDDWAAGAKKAGLGAYQIETLVKMFRYYGQHHFEGNSNVLGWLLGRPPTTLRDFLISQVKRQN